MSLAELQNNVVIFVFDQMSFCTGCIYTGVYGSFKVGRQSVEWQDQMECRRF